MNSLNPFYYRQELIDKCKVSNEEAVDLIFKKIKDGHAVTHYGNISGPYTNHCTYFMSDGTMVSMTEPASLYWVNLDLRIFE